MKDDWNHRGDNGRHLETMGKPILNGNCARQLEDNWETIPSKTNEKQLVNNLRNLGATGKNNIWETTSGKTTQETSERHVQHN